MLEREKRDYPYYRVDKETRVAKRMGICRLAVYMTSDRRDVDNQIGALYLKKTYYGVCDAIDIRSGDIVAIDGARARVVSVKERREEQVLHLESVEIIDTGAYDLEGDEND